MENASKEKYKALQDFCSIREEFFEEALFKLKLEVIVRWVSTDSGFKSFRRKILPKL